MNPEQEKVRCLLVDTITLLCRNGLTYTSDVKVQGLLAITIDSKEFFVIQIDETLAENLDDNDGDNVIDCADQPAVVDELDELSSQPMTMPSMMRKAEVENSNQSRPFGRKRVRRIVSDEMNDKKSFCPQSSQPDFLAGNYPDRFVNSLSSVSAQVKVEDDDLLLLDSSGHSVIGQNYDYGNSGGDFQPSRSDFCDGLTGATGAGLSGRSGPHQVKSRQKRKRSSGGQQWNSYEGVEWTGQGDVVSSLAANYDLDEMEEKPNQHESQQDMTTAALHPTQLTDVDWPSIDNEAQQHWEEEAGNNGVEDDGLVILGHGGRGGCGGHGGRGGDGGRGGRGGHGGYGSKGVMNRPFVFNRRRLVMSSSPSSVFDKPFACRFPGCDKRFCHETHARRHEREMHNYYRQRQKRHLIHHQQQPSSSSSRLLNSSVSSNVFPASSSSAQLNGSTRHRIHHQHRHHHHHQQQQQRQQSREPVAPGVASKLASTTSSLLHVFSNSSDQQTL